MPIAIGERPKITESAKLIDSIVWVTETEAAFRDGNPSHSVLDRIGQTFGFLRRRQRTARTAVVGVLLIAALIAIIFALVHRIAVLEQLLRAR